MTNHKTNETRAAYALGPCVLDEAEDASGNLTIRIADGTRNGNTEQEPIATVYVPAYGPLFAAAPELLALVREYYNYLVDADECGDEGPSQAQRRARAAIAKATSGSDVAQQAEGKGE